MSLTLRTTLLFVFSMLLPLSAFGSDVPRFVPQSEPGPQSEPKSGQQAQAKQQRTASSNTARAYYGLVQQIYVGYFGRPADPDGQAWFAEQFRAADAPLNMKELVRAYYTNPAVQQLIDIFSNSQESAARYPGNNEQFILALYRNLFGRVADDGGKVFWTNLLDTGAITRGNAVIVLLAGVQSLDIVIVSNKAAIADSFTGALVSAAQRAAYTGEVASFAARTLLSNVNYNTDVTAYQSTVAALIADLTIAPRIVSQPHTANLTEGYDIALAVTVAPSVALTQSYQWSKDGLPIAGATQSSYRIHGALSGDAGDYAVSVTKGAMHTQSANARVTVAQWDGSLGEWPNTVSYANSDPWLVKFHDRLVKMRPRFLVINFANGLSTTTDDDLNGGPISSEQVRLNAQKVLDQFSAGTAWQPALNPEAQPFIVPVMAKFVDLRDNNGHANSNLFPRGLTDSDGITKSGLNKLFTSDYSALFGFTENGQVIDLARAAELGLFHEMIYIVNHVGTPASQLTYLIEVATIAQAYDENLQALPGEFVKSSVDYTRQKLSTTALTAEDGNSMPWIGRSMRIYGMNVTRGAGCVMHGLSHNFEFVYYGSRVYAPGASYDGQPPNPYLSKLFPRYADFDMKSKYGIYFDALYNSAQAYGYTDCTAIACDSLVVNHDPGISLLIKNYRPVAGNCHFPPGAVSDYDYAPAATVLASVETFMKAEQVAVPFNKSKWAYLTNNPAIDQGCGGGFLVYWYQNMPGFQNTAFDLSGKPMKNWWPFLYY